MSEPLHYYVDFVADFQLPESDFEPTGEELATILNEMLPKYGVSVMGTEEDGLSYWVECNVKETKVNLMVGAEFEDELAGRWFVMPVSAKKDLFGRDKTPEGVYRKLLLAIDSVLRNCQRVERIRWFPSFEMGDYRSLLPQAASPIQKANYREQTHPLIKRYERLCQFNGFLLSPLGLITAVLLMVIFVTFVSPIVGESAGLIFFPLFLWPILSPMVLLRQISKKSAMLLEQKNTTVVGRVAPTDRA